MALAGTARTPLLEIDGVWVKLECAHPDGSVRDRAAAFLLRQAAARGELRRGDVVVESVAGAAGVALARATAAAGCRLMLFLPSDAGVLQRRLLERLGAEVRLTPATDGPAGAEAARDAYRGRRGYHVADLRRHPDNARLMRETTGAELADQLAGRGVVRLDVWVAGVGTGATLAGVGDALEARFPGLERWSPAIDGGPAAARAVAVSAGEAGDEARRLHHEHGYCVGPRAGANQRVARAAAARGLAVATLWPDCAGQPLPYELAADPAPRPRCRFQEMCQGAREPAGSR